MKRLQRLYIKEFQNLLLITTLLTGILFSLVSLIERADELLPLNLGLKDMAVICIGEVPAFISYLLPMATLISAIFVLSLASRRNELTIIRASGGNMKRFFLPFILIAIILIPIDFSISEYLSPLSSGIARSVLEKKKKDTLSFKGGELWIKGKRGIIIHTQDLTPEGREAFVVSVFFTKGGKLIKRIEAERGRWESDSLTLHDATIYDIKKKSVSRKKEINIKGVESPEPLNLTGEGLYEMGGIELLRYYRRLHAMGYENRKLLTDIHSRFSYPFTLLFMICTGIVLST
ncbi:MAG: YjgP/YjgQ family permease, partial [Nitrospirae bacterium]